MRGLLFPFAETKQHPASGRASASLEYPDKKLVKVWGQSQRKAICKNCGEPVEWFKTVNRERVMLFNGDVAPLKTGTDEASGEPLFYLDRQDCHWEKCSSVLPAA